MDKSVYTAKINEYSVRSDILHNPFEDLSFFELSDDFSFLLFNIRFNKRFVRYHNVLEFMVDFHYLELHSLIDKLVVVADRFYIDLRTR